MVSKHKKNSIANRTERNCNNEEKERETKRQQNGAEEQEARALVAENLDEFRRRLSKPCETATLPRRVRIATLSNAAVVHTRRWVDHLRVARVDIWYGILAAAILAVGFSRAVFAAKQNLRVLIVPLGKGNDGVMDYKRVGGGLLVQTQDTKNVTPGELRVVTRLAPTAAQMAA